MIKGIATVRKRADLDAQAFHRYWREIHAPLALRMKSLRRYVQSHRIDNPMPGFESCPLRRGG